eukprot:tig00020912_g15850.t1
MSKPRGKGPAEAAPKPTTISTLPSGSILYDGDPKYDWRDYMFQAITSFREYYERSRIDPSNIPKTEYAEFKLQAKTKRSPQCMEILLYNNLIATIFPTEIAVYDGGWQSPRTCEYLNELIYMLNVDAMIIRERNHFEATVRGAPRAFTNGMRFPLKEQLWTDLKENGPAGKQKAGPPPPRPQNARPTAVGAAPAPEPAAPPPPAPSSQERAAWPTLGGGGPKAPPAASQSKPVSFAAAAAAAAGGSQGPAPPATRPPADKPTRLVTAGPHAPRAPPRSRPRPPRASGARQLRRSQRRSPLRSLPPSQPRPRSQHRPGRAPAPAPAAPPVPAPTPAPEQPKAPRTPKPSEPAPKPAEPAPAPAPAPPPEPPAVDVPSVADQAARVYFYFDPKGNTHGPFPFTTLKRWFEDKFFPSDMQVFTRTDGAPDGPMGESWTISQLVLLADRDPAAPEWSVVDDSGSVLLENLPLRELARLRAFRTLPDSSIVKAAHAPFSVQLKVLLVRPAPRAAPPSAPPPAPATAAVSPARAQSQASSPAASAEPKPAAPYPPATSAPPAPARPARSGPSPSIELPLPSPSAAAAAPSPTPPPSSPGDAQWLYRDPQMVLQGPFSLPRLLEWLREGYLPPDLGVWAPNMHPTPVALATILARSGLLPAKELQQMAPYNPDDPAVWFYMDPMNQPRGPFTWQQLIGWSVNMTAAGPNGTPFLLGPALAAGMYPAASYVSPGYGVPAGYGPPAGYAASFVPLHRVGSATQMRGQGIQIITANQGQQRSYRNQNRRRSGSDESPPRSGYGPMSPSAAIAAGPNGLAAPSSSGSLSSA